MNGIIPALSVPMRKGVTQTRYNIQGQYQRWFNTEIPFNGAMCMYAISNSNSADAFIDIAEDGTVTSYHHIFLNARVVDGYIQLYTTTDSSASFWALVYT